MWSPKAGPEYSYVYRNFLGVRESVYTKLCEDVGLVLGSEERKGEMVKGERDLFDKFKEV